MIAIKFNSNSNTENYNYEDIKHFKTIRNCLINCKFEKEDMLPLDISKEIFDKILFKDFNKIVSEDDFIFIINKVLYLDVEHDSDTLGILLKKYHTTCPHIDINNWYPEMLVAMIENMDFNSRIKTYEIINSYHRKKLIDRIKTDYDEFKDFLFLINNDEYSYEIVYYVNIFNGHLDEMHQFAIEYNLDKILVYFDIYVPNEIHENFVLWMKKQISDNESKLKFEILKHHIDLYKINLDIPEYDYFKGGSIHKSTLLHLACYYDNIDIVEILLNLGVSVNTYDTFKANPLHIACQQLNKEIIELLIAFGANVNEINFYSDSPLHVACQYDDVKIIDLLINAGADINISTFNGITPLHMACMNECLNVIDYLLTKGANPYILAYLLPRKKATAIEMILSNFNGGRSLMFEKEIIEIFIKHKFNFEFNNVEKKLRRSFFENKNTKAYFTMLHIDKIH